MRHLAVQNMECPKNSMIIARQWTLCKMRKGKVFKSIFRRIFLKKQDSYANRGDKWVNSHWKTSPTPPSEENAQDTRTTELSVRDSTWAVRKRVTVASGNTVIGKLWFFCFIGNLVATHHIGGRLEETQVYGREPLWRGRATCVLRSCPVTSQRN